MLFSSLTFLVWFLPAVIIIHLLLPRSWRNAFLLAASIFFYAWGEMRYVPLILCSMVLNYVFGLMVGRGSQRMRRLWLALSVAFNMGALVYFKYANFLLTSVGLAFLAPQVVMPLGISFYTFQIQSYVVDVYRGTVPSERNPINVWTYILLFPQLIAGPIVLYTQVQRELQARDILPAQLERGMAQFIAGLAAKVLLANPLGAMSSQIIGRAASSAPAMWLATTAGVLQLYFDFAGYSQMAIGMGNMMGFAFPRNFDHPLAAASMRDFWRRWHITLSAWLRDYLYIPLGGSRLGQARTLVNLFIVWFVSGLWHGADWNHILWGLWFFVWIALERTRFGRWVDRHPRLGFAYTQLAFLLAWPLFNYSSLGDAAAHLGRMLNGSAATDVLYWLRANGVLLFIAIACCAPGICRRAAQWVMGRAWVRVAALGMLLALCVAALINEAYNPFIYFRF